MIEFKIQLEDKFVQKLGYKAVESYLQDFKQKLELKFAAQDVLRDLKDIDLENDEQWQLSRSLAWQQESHKYI